MGSALGASWLLGPTFSGVLSAPLRGCQDLRSSSGEGGVMLWSDGLWAGSGLEACFIWTGECFTNIKKKMR